MTRARLEVSTPASRTERRPPERGGPGGVSKLPALASDTSEADRLLDGLAQRGTRRAQALRHRRTAVATVCAAALLAGLAGTELAFRSRPEVGQSLPEPGRTSQVERPAGQAAGPAKLSDLTGQSTPAAARDSERAEFESRIAQARAEADRAARAATAQNEALAAALAARSAELAEARQALDRLAAERKGAAEQASRDLAAEKAAAQVLRGQLERDRARLKEVEEQLAASSRQQAERVNAQSAAAALSAEAASAATEKTRQLEAKLAGAEREATGLRAALETQRANLARAEANLADAGRQRAASEEAAAQSAAARRSAEDAARALSERLRQEQTRAAGGQRQLDGLRVSLEAERSNIQDLEAKLAEAVRNRGRSEDALAQQSAARREADKTARAAAERLRVEEARAEASEARLRELQAGLDGKDVELRQLEARLAEIGRDQAKVSSERDDAVAQAARAAGDLDGIRSGTAEILAWLEGRLRAMLLDPVGSERATGERQASAGAPAPADPAIRDGLARIAALLELRAGEARALRDRLQARLSQGMVRLSSPLQDLNAVWTGAGPQTAIFSKTLALPDAPSVQEARHAAPPAEDPRPQPHTEETIAPQVDGTAVLARAESFLARGDLVGARLLLEHAAGAGHALALFKLAETYDPRNPILRRMGGALADRVRAMQLYADAASAGFKGAEDRIAALR
ncbi:hypothetical protein [Enterovirga aerilata]|uniref:Uncharacterized protein n=1 Tax=Enterovirga aerilata TaxID=2730920 RepID=A0A849I8G0_9HYPH|nr:hypothetical protein [Enterovirga sp. DB1703]NNM74074.1 hypothetical protein [Enterovirga sp. DB1703]